MISTSIKQLLLSFKGKISSYIKQISSKEKAGKNDLSVIDDAEDMKIISQHFG